MESLEILLKKVKAKWPNGEHSPVAVTISDIYRLVESTLEELKNK